MRMLRGCIIAAISYLLVIVTTIWHCSYTDVDKIFLKFTKQTNKKRIFLSPLESNYCCHFLIRNSWSQCGLWPLGARALTSICEQRSPFTLLPQIPEVGVQSSGHKWFWGQDSATGAFSLLHARFNVCHIRAAALTCMHYYILATQNDF